MCNKDTDTKHKVDKNLNE